MAKFTRNKQGCLLKFVEEKALSKKVETEEDKREVPYLGEDCISSILIRLPLESLPRSRFVCKPWYNIINSPVFIDAQFRLSETVLIFLKPVPVERLYDYPSMSRPIEQPNVFSVESSLAQPSPVTIFGQRVSHPRTKSYIQFIEFKDGNGKLGEYNVSCGGNIRATCNGLILLDNKLKKGGLLLMNPVTRKLKLLPLGTIIPPQDESYGFVFNEVTGDYKIVHLFRDELNYVSCEILNLTASSWREVNGPAFGVFGWFGYDPVSALRALHWIPQIDRSEYIVSMEVDTDKFRTTPLPKICRAYDRIIEMGGFICFVTHEELNIDIWNLKSLEEGKWSKQYSITRGTIMDLVPLFSLRINGDVIFKRDENRSFYVYDFRLQEIRKIEMDPGYFAFHRSYAPHVNSLLSWTR